MNSLVVSADRGLAGLLVAALAVHGKTTTAEPDETVEETHFDVVVFQGALGQLTEWTGRAPVLVLGPNEPEAMLEAVEIGARGYLDEKATLEEITDAARQIATGAAVISPLLLGPLLRSVIDRRRREREELRRLEVLTPREREIFDLAARGMTRRALAAHLVISPDTARTHLQKVMTKLDLHSQAELVALAARCGLEVTP
jgi:DNA-binding NarL/FixJ family response regulator